MGKTSIEWATRSVNPIRARNRETGNTGHYCQKISPECANCYAAAFNVRRRFARPDGTPDVAGTGLDYIARNRTNVDVYFDEESLLKEARRKQPERIFPFDMTDLFGDWVRDEWRTRAWDIMWGSPQHTWMILTKRFKEAAHWCRDNASGLQFGWCSRFHHEPMVPGTQLSIEDIGMSNECGWRSSHFCNHPDAAKDGNDDPEGGGRPWCSCWNCPIGWEVTDKASLIDWGVIGKDEEVESEVVDGVEQVYDLEPEGGGYIELHRRPRSAFAPNVWIGFSVGTRLRLRQALPWLTYLRHSLPHAVLWLSVEPLLEDVDFSEALRDIRISDGCAGSGPVYKRLVDWIVLGGESGYLARPFNPDWARSVRDLCQSRGVPFFMKQMGSQRKPFPPIPDDLMIREFPQQATMKVSV